MKRLEDPIVSWNSTIIAKNHILNPQPFDCVQDDYLGLEKSNTSKASRRTKRQVSTGQLNFRYENDNFLEIKCKSNSECFEWIGNTFFCTKGVKD